MKTFVKKYDELINAELFEIFRLRSEAFVVEQKYSILILTMRIKVHII